MRNKFIVTVIELDFLKIKDDEKRQRLLAMPTSFKLNAQQLDELIPAGAELPETSKTFQEFIDRIQ